jgi:dienelactone hydrolase
VTSVRPALLDTPIGPIGAILTEAQAPARASMLILQGGLPRYGPNRVWARIAEVLAERGVTVARMDYPGHGDSGAAADGEVARRRAASEVAAWLRSETGDAPQLLLGSCGGARPVTAIAAESPPPAGVALIVPYLRTARSRRPAVRAIRRTMARVARPLLRLRNAPVQRIDRSMPAALDRAARAAPVWVLVGEGDFSHKDVTVVSGSLDDVGVHVDVVPGLMIHSLSTPAIQDETLRRVLAWAQGHLERVA